MKLGPDLFPGFMGVWIALGGLGFYLFHVRKDAGFKRTWFPRFAIAAGVLFWAFLLLMGMPAGVLVIAGRPDPHQPYSTGPAVRSPPQR